MSFDRYLLTDYWHLLCHRSELPRHGDYRCLQTVIGEVTVFNDGAGLVVFDNRCPHRGARIYNEGHGNGAATCGYHGWTHSHGTLIIPQRDRFAGCDLSRAQLLTYPTEWCADFLFFSVMPTLALDAQLGRTIEVLENISFNIAGCADVNQYVYECYWPLAVENALEPYHIDLVHPQTLATLELEAGHNEFMGMNSIWKAPIGNKRLFKQLSGLRRYFNIDFCYDGYMSLYLFPFTMLSSTFGYSYSLQHFFPRDEQGTCTTFSSRLLTVPTRDAKADQLVASFLQSTAQVNRRVFDEDHEICRRMPRDSWSAEPLRFAADSEEKIQHFRASCRHALAPNSQS